MRIDFQAEADKIGGGLYPEDTYNVRITGFERTMSQSNNPQVKWSAVITDGAFQGKKITDFTMLTERGVWKTVKMIKAALNIESFKALGTVDSDSVEFDRVLQRCVGKNLQWFVGYREYNGKTYNDVQDYLPSQELALDEEMKTMKLDDIPGFLRENQE